MLNRQQLLNDLKALLKRTEIDLRERAEAQGDSPEIHKKLTTEYERARKAERTAATFEEWRSEQITQKAVAWILSCVFARFLEDNQLIDPPLISGPDDRLKWARDEHELYFRNHPKETDREYLLDGFAKLANLPGGREIFGEHNAIHVYPGWLSGDAAGELLTFFQTIDPGNGELIHDFTDEKWDTRFLGDLYQDLSEAARKKYALLQTPDFVEAFILDRTLEPALDEFGLNAPPVKNRNGDEIAPTGFRMIDPACGSGHFLLGAFDRIFERWLKTEPVANSRNLAQRTLGSIHGVDINPFAVAIARFRLLLQAMKACGVDKLKNCPAFELNLACGDSLLHGERSYLQIELTTEPVSHCYETEDTLELKRILRHGIYHTVVANPPYITPKEKRQNINIRQRYKSCYRAYALSVPFMERIQQLAINGDSKFYAGYTGQITANSFMKREFGKKLIEDFIPKWDLTHIIDTSLAFIPGHNAPGEGTTTVILLARNQRPVSSKIRAVMGIRGEPSVPLSPARGKVWRAIISQIDQPGSKSVYVSVEDVPRLRFSKHPWSVGGGGTSSLKEMIEANSNIRLSSVTENAGFSVVTREDDVYQVGIATLHRRGIAQPFIIQFVIGAVVRDWIISSEQYALWPYQKESLDAKIDTPSYRMLWPYRTGLSQRVAYGKTQIERGNFWFEYSMFFRNRYRKPKSIVNAFVATHNHFIINSGNKVFHQSAPITILKSSINDADYIGLIGLLNSSVSAFWARQVLYKKGGAKEPWADRLEWATTPLQELPIPSIWPVENAQLIKKLGAKMSTLQPVYRIERHKNHDSLDLDQEKYYKIQCQMISAQEELDWKVYFLYGLINEDLTYKGDIIQIDRGNRAFEIIMAREMTGGELETTWFEHHNSTPIIEIPYHWPVDYKQLVEKRIKAIEENPRTIGLIEKPEYKRRWNLESWDSQLEKALKNWLLDRLESYFDFDGRMNDKSTITAKMEIGLTTTARLADIARTDEQFIEVAELYRNRPDFDVAGLVADLVESESVPLLPVCRYKPTGMDNRAAWERTWQLQRIEDTIDSFFDTQRLSKTEGKDLPQGYKDEILTLLNRLKTIFSQNKDQEIKSLSPEKWLEYQVVSALTFVTSAREKGLDLDSGRVQHKLGEPAKDVKNRLVGDIPVPPKYTTKDFQNTTCWQLRGKLDVPKERWVSFPYCEGEDQSMVTVWAGYDHLQLSQAIAAYYVDIQERTGGREDPRLEILLCCMMEILPWVKQWHNDIDPDFNIRMGDYYQGFIADEARQMEKTIEEIQKWQPPKRTPNRRRKKQRQK